MKYSVIILSIICIAAGVVLGYAMKPEISMAFETVVQNVDMTGFAPLNVSIHGTTVRLSSECRQIAFDVTDDQALSIAKALNISSPPRPLPHDIFVDVLENFQIKHLTSKIDSYSEGVYYAHMVLQLGNSVLELDARPSDTLAVSLRTKTKIYMDRKILEEHGEKIC